MGAIGAVDVAREELEVCSASVSFMRDPSTFGLDTSDDGQSFSVVVGNGTTGGSDVA